MKPARAGSLPKGRVGEGLLSLGQEERWLLVGHLQGGGHMAPVPLAEGTPAFLYPVRQYLHAIVFLPTEILHV